MGSFGQLSSVLALSAPQSALERVWGWGGGGGVGGSLGGENGFVRGYIEVSPKCVLECLSPLCH